MLHISIIKASGGPLNVRNILLQNGSIENTKLGAQYGATKSQLPRNVDWAQSSIERKLIPPKDINSQA